MNLLVCSVVSNNLRTSTRDTSHFMGEKKNNGSLSEIVRASSVLAHGTWPIPQERDPRSKRGVCQAPGAVAHLRGAPPGNPPSGAPTKEVAEGNIREPPRTSDIDLLDLIDIDMIYPYVFKYIYIYIISTIHTSFGDINFPLLMVAIKLKI